MTPSQHELSLIKSSFARNLKILREIKGLTQKELAQAINTSSTNISAYENEKAFPSDVIFTALTDFFDVTAEELIGYEIASSEAQATGANITRRVSITPLEDQLLFVFRCLRIKHGAATQRAIIDMIEKMLYP